MVWKCWPLLPLYFNEELDICEYMRLKNIQDYMKGPRKSAHLPTNKSDCPCELPQWKQMGF